MKMKLVFEELNLSKGDSIVIVRADDKGNITSIEPTTIDKVTSGGLYRDKAYGMLWDATGRPSEFLDSVQRCYIDIPDYYKQYMSEQCYISDTLVKLKKLDSLTYEQARKIRDVIANR